MTKLTFPISDELREVFLSDSTVSYGIRTESSLENIICVLVREKKLLLEEIMKLQQIAPFKIRTDEGVKVWRCSDEFVPFRGGDSDETSR